MKNFFLAVMASVLLVAGCSKEHLPSVTITGGQTCDQETSIGCVIFITTQSEATLVVAYALDGAPNSQGQYLEFQPVEGSDDTQIVYLAEPLDGDEDSDEENYEDGELVSPLEGAVTLLGVRACPCEPGPVFFQPTGDIASLRAVFQHPFGDTLETSWSHHQWEGNNWNEVEGATGEKTVIFRGLTASDVIEVDFPAPP